MESRVLAIIPAFNEADGIGQIVSHTLTLVDQVIVIDDGSSDRTAVLAEAAGAQVIRHPHNLGKGAAIGTALNFFRASDAAYAVFLDADGQHDPAEIGKFVEAARVSGAGVVIGTRMAETRDMPRLRLWTNQFTSWITGKLARQHIPDSQCGFRLLSRAVVGDLHLTSNRFETETEMLIQAGRAGHKIVSIKIRTIYNERFRPSHINPIRDTIRFFKLISRYL